MFSPAHEARSQGLSPLPEYRAAWEFDRFAPMGAIPSTVNLTTYAGESIDFMETPLQMVLKEVEEGRMTPKIGRVFELDAIVEAHRCMEDNAAGGKIVVLT